MLARTTRMVRSPAHLLSIGPKFPRGFTTSRVSFGAGTVADSEMAATDRIVAPPRGAYTDTAAFLTVIGRDCAQYASKIGSWETLMTADTRRLRELGVADAPKRKYILSWVGYYKMGIDPWAVELVPKPQRGPKWRY